MNVTAIFTLNGTGPAGEASSDLPENLKLQMRLDL